MTRGRGAILVLAIVAAIGAHVPGAYAGGDLPPLDRVAFSPAPGAQLPLEASLVDEESRAVRLGQYVRERPAIVVPAYYGCTNLCTVVLRGLGAALAASRLRAGDDLDVVVISIDPHDTPATASQKKRSLLADFPPAEAGGWHFLTGSEPAITAVTAALGYRYAYVPDERQYAHAGGIAVVDAGGRVARVMYGVAFDAAALRDAVETAATTDRDTAAASAPSDIAQNWLLCFHYDPQAGRYSFAAMNAVRSAGLLALLALVAYFVAARRQERRRARSKAP